jgi:predicted HTH domain antitoxin
MINLTEALGQISRDNDWNDIMIGAKILDIWTDLEITSNDSGNAVSVRKFQKGTLFLRARSSTWKVQINLQAEELMDKINSALGRNYIQKIDISI